MKYKSVITLSIRALTWSSLLTSQALASHTPPECYQVRISPTCHHISLARHMMGSIYDIHYTLSCNTLIIDKVGPSLAILFTMVDDMATCWFVSNDLA